MHPSVAALHAHWLADMLKGQNWWQRDGLRAKVCERSSGCTAYGKYQVIDRAGHGIAPWALQYSDGELMLHVHVMAHPAWLRFVTAATVQQLT